ncbi:hypothetical protein F0521_26100 [Ferrimonas sp. YFM]|nr:hypothetical protein F0521_26100 [Ferrimonas sp. YFM]
MGEFRLPQHGEKMMAAPLTGLVNQQLIDDFSSRLAEFGLGRFYYTLLPNLFQKEKTLMDCDRSLDWKRFFNLKRMRYAVASDEDILRYREEYLQRFAHTDGNFRQGGFKPQWELLPCVWHDDGIPSRRLAGFRKLKQRHGFETRLVFYHVMPGREDIVGLCMLFSDKPADELETMLASSRQELAELIQAYSETFNALTFRSINPLANFGVLSPTCIQILAQVAEGFSSEEIGQQLFMTERGVNYHLDRARQILAARNRTNLVSKAYQQGVL